MIGLFRQSLSFGVAGVLTWWLLFHVQVPGSIVHGAEPADESVAPPLSLQPVVEEIVEVASVEPEVETVQEEEPHDAPPPPEAGSREGADDGELAEAPVVESEEVVEVPPAPPEPDPEPSRRSVDDLREDVELLEVAEQELTGRAAVGFTTTLVSRPEDQLAIARAFGEDVVLVPRRALDDGDEGAVSYRLDLSRSRPVVREIPGRPPLERYRQYRDLFAYDFALLPEPMRQLRKSVVRRDHVFLFAALVPPAEWAVVVGRRREALESLDLREGDVERFVIRYVRRPNERFDIRVDEIVLADGTRHRPIP